MKEQIPNKIYIIIGDFSRWDSHYKRVLRAFYNKEDAEKYVEKANRVLGAFSKYVQDANESTDKFEEDSIEYLLYLNIWSYHSEFEEFNKCSIEEIEIK